MTKKWKKHSRRALVDIANFLPRTLRHSLYRYCLIVDHNPPASLRLKIAESKEELEAAFSLLYDAYLAEGLLKPNPWKMQMTKHHVLPTTVTLIACWDNEVVAAASLVQDSPLRLPMETFYDVNRFRANGDRVAEVSALAIKPGFPDPSRVVFPLTKFVWEYAFRYVGIDFLVTMAKPAVAEFYEAILLMERIPRRLTVLPSQKPAEGLVLDLHRTANDLHQYYTETRLKNICFPDREFSKCFDSSISRDLLVYFITHTSDLLETLTEKEKKLLDKMHEGGPEQRYPAHLRATLSLGDRHLSVRLRDVSSNGLKAFLPEASPIPAVDVRLTVPLSPLETASLVARPLWSRQQSWGFKITESSPNWKHYLTYLESA